MSDPIFIATTGHGISRAACTAGEWMVANLLKELDVRCLSTDPLNPQVIYAGTDGQGVWRSNDTGLTWQEMGLRSKQIRSVTASPTQSGVMYAGTKPPGLFVSRDSGLTWHELNSFSHMRQWWWFTPAESGAEYVQAIALSPTDPDLILAGIEFGAVIRSSDGGQTWSHHRRGALRDCHTMIFHNKDGNRAYECGGGGASLSQDGGKTWLKPRKGLDRFYGWAVGADGEDPNIWYVSLSPGPFKAHGDKSAEAYIFRMSDNGAWAKLGGGLPQPLERMPYALLTDADQPGTVYAGLSNGDVWHSADYGDHWDKMPFNLGAIHRTLILVLNKQL